MDECEYFPLFYYVDYNYRNPIRPVWVKLNWTGRKKTIKGGPWPKVYKEHRFFILRWWVNEEDIRVMPSQRKVISVEKPTNDPT